MSTYTGTIAYSAPEIFSCDHYTEEVDMWSAGCILYTMLSGYPPFMAEYVADLIEIIKNGTYDLERAPWNEVSEDAKNLVMGMLTKDPENRILPTQALRCAWLQSDEEKMDKAKMPMIMAFAINNLKLNSVKLLRKRQDTIKTLLAGSFTKMLRQLTLEDIGDSPHKTGEMIKNQIKSLTEGGLGKDGAEAKKFSSLEAVEEEAQKPEQKVTLIANEMPDQREL